MAKQNLRIVDRELAKRKPRTDQERIAMLENYVRALDPPREPVTFSSKATVFGKWGQAAIHDGFIPGCCLIRFMLKAPPMKLSDPPSDRGTVKIGRKWSPATSGIFSGDRILSFINLGIFGKREEADVV